MNTRAASLLTALALLTLALPSSGCGGCECILYGGSGTADLALGKTVSNAAPNVGDTITFTITLTNLGPDTATDVQVLDFLPPGLTFVSAVASQGAYVPLSGFWVVGSVTVGAPQTLVIQTTVASPSPQTNTAMIASADQSDPDSANNAASATEAAAADLALTKTVSDPTPNVGDTIAFTVTLTNNGVAGATNVEVQDLLPVGLIFVSSTPSQGTYDFMMGVWAVGSVAVGTPQTLVVNAGVASPDPRTNTATISSSDEFDPDIGNNTASATETPQMADLSLIKTVSNNTPNVGDTVTFTVTLSNAGPDAATNVQVFDLLPMGLSFVSAVPTQGSYTPATGQWVVGTVAFGATQILSIQAMVTSPALQTNTASITAADQFDPNTANNSASSSIASP